MFRSFLLSVTVILCCALAAAAEGKIAVLLDVAGRGDVSFNDMGVTGAEEAAIEFGLNLVQVYSNTSVDYLPNLRNMARTGEYDLIICIGFLFYDALIEVSSEFRDQKFAIIDAVVDAPNVMSFVFRENEMAALVGALAAMAAAQHGYEAVGLVLGIETPVLWNVEAGFRYGMSWGLSAYADHEGSAPQVDLLYTYTGSFSDIAVGKAASEAMLARGAVGIYNAAGALGIGDFDAVAEAHDEAGTTYGPPYYFGGDTNQDYLGEGRHGLASGVKHINRAAYMAIESVVYDSFEAGVTRLDLADQGVSISGLNALQESCEQAIDAGVIVPADSEIIVENWVRNHVTVAEWIWNAIRELTRQIITGNIVVPTADSYDEIGVVRTDYPDDALREAGDASPEYCTSQTWMSSSDVSFNLEGNTSCCANVATGLYLYSGTKNTAVGGQIWRSSDGEAWERVSDPGFGDEFNTSTYPCVAIGEVIYACTKNEVTGAEVWRLGEDGVWRQVNTDGFGNAANTYAELSGPFDGFIYAGTTNTEGGAEIWRSADGEHWTCVSSDGFGDPANVSCEIPVAFDGYIYAGTVNEESGGTVWRSTDGSDWVPAGPDAGFGFPSNCETIPYVSLEGYIYCGTSNEELGGQIWRSSDGAEWEQVVDAGFGNPFNESCCPYVVFENVIYAGTFNASAGAEIWASSDGIAWQRATSFGVWRPSAEGLFPYSAFQDVLFGGSYDPEGCRVVRAVIDTQQYLAVCESFYQLGEEP